METEEVLAKADVVRFCLLDKCYNQAQRRVTIVVKDEGVRTAVGKAMEQLGFQRKSGRAPASHMERDVQMRLEELLKICK